MLFRTRQKSATALVTLPLSAAATTVIALLLRSCPAAVIRRVWTVVVYPIKAVFFRRTDAHVGKKQFEIVPSVAQLNPSPAIAFIGSVVGIKAAILHRIPDGVFSRSHATVPRLKHLASTPFVGRFFQTVASAKEHETTKTPAFVDVFSAGVHADRAKNCDSAKHAATKVDMCWHAAIVPNCGVIANRMRRA